MNSFFKRLKTSSDFEIDSKLEELIKKTDCLQTAQARLRDDILQIVSKGLKSILSEGNKKRLAANSVNEKKCDPNEIYYDHQMRSIWLEYGNDPTAKRKN